MAQKRPINQNTISRMPDEPTRVFTVRLPEAAWIRLKLLAAKNRKTMGFEIVEAVAKHLDKNRAKLEAA